MKKFLIAISAFLCALVGFVAVACGKTDKVGLKFDTQCEITMEDVSLKKGEEYTLPAPASRGAEWEFGGWYLDPECTGDAVTSVVVESDMTVYAKWIQLYKLNLNLNGGTLAGADNLYLKQGTAVAAFLADYVPSKDKHQFGRWMNGNSELGDGFKMPASALTLSAEYKVAYTIDVYTQSLAYLEDPTAGHAEYEKESITLYAYATADFTVEYAPQGLRETTAPAGYPERVGAGELKDNPADGDNTFVLYFNRELYTIRLNSNVAGSTREVEYHYYYDQLFELPYDLFTNVGYVFAGWSESASGENDYPIDYIDAVLYNKQAGNTSEVKREKEYRAKSDATLYAYWNKGYTDLFGAEDTIFLLSENAKDIYLFRGGKFFKGEYEAKSRSFTFFDKNDEKVLFEGRLLEGNVFCYASTSRADTRALYFSYESGLNEKIRLDLDEYNGVTYTETDGFGFAHSAKGTYKYDSENYEYTAYFESGEGELVGRTVHFIFGSYRDMRVFLIRNDAEYEMGMLQRLGITSNGMIGSIQLPYYSLILTGYGYGFYYNGADPILCYYVYDSEMEAYVVTDQNGYSICNAKLVNEGGLSGYMPYSPALDDEFTGDDGSLILDGLMHATFVSGTTAISGYYTLATSYRGGYIVSLTSNGKAYTFLMLKHEEGTDKDKVIYYTVEQKPAGYMEYLYYIGGTALGQDIAYRPMLVIDDEVAGQANFYDYVNGTYVKAATGTYSRDEESGLYTITSITAIPDVDHSNSLIDVSNLQSMLFALDTDNTSFRVYYAYSLTDLEGETTLNVKEYKPSREDQKAMGMKLLIIGGIAVFTDGNDKGIYIGKYQTSNGLTRITARVGNRISYIYLEITEGEDGQNGTFIKYDTTPYTAYLYREDGTRYTYEYLEFDGKGGVTYTYRNEEGEFVTITGTFEEVGKLSSASIYLFTQTDAENEPMTFRYILVSDGTYMYFSKISDKEGTYSSALGTLTLDGTGFTATYTDTYGNTYMSQYRVRLERENGLTVIYLYANGQYRYFEIDSTNHTFREIGSELGTYLIMDNQYFDGRYVELDGDGNFILYNMVETDDAEGEGEEEEVEPSASGSEVIAKAKYTVSSDGLVTLTYTESLNGVDTPATIVGRLGALQMGNYIYSVFVIQYNSIADTYVNEADYSVLVLNDTGVATRYLASGKVESGSYTLITDTTLGADYNMLYYVNNQGTDATIYEYDPVNKLIWRVENSDRAYFSSDLSSLRFTRYGFAIFDGTTRYYYHQKTDATGNIVIGYTIFRASREEIDGKTPNKYGFIEYEVTVDGRSIEYNDTTYYDNGGFSISFNRITDTAENYPYTATSSLLGKSAKFNLTRLTFSPSGSTEFSVTGTVLLTRVGDDADFVEELNAPVNIVRRLLDEEGHYEMYIMIGFYRFDIDMNYDTTGGNQSTYNITQLRFYADADSYLYWYNVYQFGVHGMDPSLVPYFGHMTLWRDYDEAGDASEDGFFMSGDFGEEVIPCLDANGNSIFFEGAPCEYDEATDMYTVTVDYTEIDGYLYKGVYMLDTSMGIVTYRLAGFYREQKLQSNGYTVKVGRLIASESQNNVPGNITVLGIENEEGEDITDVALSWIDGKYCVIAREYEKDEEGKDTKKIKSSTYFIIEFTEKGGEVVEGIVKPYESAEITVIENIMTYYTADGKAYVEIDADNNEVLLYYSGRYYYVASESEYFAGDNENDPYYIMTMKDGNKYKITLKTKEEGDGQYVVVETYVDPDEEE